MSPESGQNIAAASSSSYRPQEDPAVVCQPCLETDSQEETDTKALAQPPKRTPQMMKDHEIAHIPVRAWCAHCVRGRGKSMQHRQIDHSDETISTVSLDFAFFSCPGEFPGQAASASEMPVLIIKDRASKACWSHLVAKKGIDE